MHTNGTESHEPSLRSLGQSVHTVATSLLLRVAADMSLNLTQEFWAGDEVLMDAQEGI